MEVKPGWIRRKRDKLEAPGQVKVEFTFTADGIIFGVIADAAGVQMKGVSPVFTGDGTGLDDFAWILAEAMREYLKLKRDLAARLVT